MILDLTHDFAFIHITRTAGLSISQAIVAGMKDPTGLLVDLVDGRHATARQIRRRVGPKKWDKLYRFAVIRSPWEIIESDWRLTLRETERLGPLAQLDWRPQWYARVARVAVHRSFDRFVRDEYLVCDGSIYPDGFWREWCLGSRGEEIGVEPILYDRLADEWPRICDRVGITRCELPRLNGTGPRGPITWSDELADEIGVVCSGDIDRFGFRPPNVTHP